MCGNANKSPNCSNIHLQKDIKMSHESEELNHIKTLKPKVSKFNNVFKCGKTQIMFRVKQDCQIIYNPLSIA